MSTLIYYNNNQIVSGQPTPLFGLTDMMIKYGERWCASSQVKLQGQLTGCTYNSIITAKTNLEQLFTKDFQPFSIIQDGEILYQSNYNRITDINFDNSLYVGVLDYTISLESYPKELFSGFYGIISPINEWSFAEQDNKILEITHKISAKGIVTASNNSNAFDNAKNYVLGLTGANSFINPYFINYCSGINLCVDTFKETINRFENVYSIEEKYIVDLYNGGAGYIRYVAQYDCDINKGVATLSLNGEVKSCRNADLPTLRNKYTSFDAYSAAVQSYKEASNKIDLNPNYLSSGVSEDIYNKKIGFNIQFDNDFTPKTYFDYTTEIKIDEVDVTTVDIKGVIKSRGDLKVKWQNVQDYYNNQLNLFYLSNQAYVDFNNGNVIYPLNQIQQSYSVTKNPFVAEISVGTSYNNKDILPIEFKDLDYTLSFRPSFYQIQSLPLVNFGSGSSCNKDYYTVNLNYLNRATLEMRGKAVGTCTGTYNSTNTALKNLANYTILQYGTTDKIFLDKNSVNTSNNFQGLDFDFDFQWSFNAKQSATISPFNFINSLLLN